MDYLTNTRIMHDKLNDRYVTRVSEQNQLLKRKEELQELIGAINIEMLEKMSIVLQKMSESQRKYACAKLKDLCTYALQYSLSPNYEMEIEITKSRGKPAADVYIKKLDVGYRTNPNDSNGGGVIDIVSMALRFVTMQVYEPFIDGPVILDEPYKMVSEDFIPTIAEFIKKLSADFGRQIILCTHNKFLAQIADEQIHVALGPGNESEVSETW